MNRLFIVAAAASLLGAGCAAPTPLTSEDHKDLQPVICASQAQCQTMWQMAQLWVVNNSAYKIQMANDVVIQTYNPSKSSVKSGFTVTKEPYNGERQIIKIRSYCDNMFGCNPSASTLELAFYRHLRKS